MATERQSPNGDTNKEPEFVVETGTQQAMSSNAIFVVETAGGGGPGPTFNPAWARQANQYIGVNFR